jgi:hypothetical protein
MNPFYARVIHSLTRLAYALSFPAAILLGVQNVGRRRHPYLTAMGAVGVTTDVAGTALTPRPNNPEVHG